MTSGVVQAAVGERESEGERVGVVASDEQQPAGVVEAAVGERESGGERVGVVASGEQPPAPAEELTPVQVRFRRVLSQRHGGMCVVLENVEKV